MDTSAMVTRRPRGRGDSGLPAIEECRMMARALAERWPVEPAMRERALELCYRVLNMPDATPGQILAATKLLIMADGVNVRREANAIREATPPAQQINIFGDVTQYAGAFGEPARGEGPAEAPPLPAPEPPA